MSWSFSGKHVLAEFRGIDPAVLDDEALLCDMLRAALGATGATVCALDSKHFDPQGVTVLALLAESHASVHTYPEHGAMFLDVFTCGERAKPDLAVELLRRALRPSHADVEVIVRGGGGATPPETKESPWPASVNRSDLVSSGTGTSTTSFTPATPLISVS